MSQIVIFGSGSGIWYSLSEYYTLLKKDLILTVRTEPQKQKLVEKFPWTEIYVVDFLSISDIHSICDILQTRDISHILFCVWLGSYEYFWLGDTQKIQDIFQINTIAPLTIFHTFFKNSIIKFVFFSSLMAHFYPKNMALYAASKKALSHTLRTMTQEDPHKNILILHIGAVQTEMHLKAWLQKMLGKKLSEVTPKLANTIENANWESSVFFSWWFLRICISPIQKIFLSLKRLWKKYL